MGFTLRDIARMVGHTQPYISALIKRYGINSWRVRPSTETLFDLFQRDSTRKLRGASLGLGRHADRARTRHSRMMKKGAFYAGVPALGPAGIEHRKLKRKDVLRKRKTARQRRLMSHAELEDHRLILAARRAARTPPLVAVCISTDPELGF